ncbi:MAG: tripartite tricarboxylate transporter substrate binding protein [Betaproteobacteria bacterium]|nr:tripartite tricarboxylate transporter substrate binding protein [Betaproteobacteria bacterium]
MSRHISTGLAALALVVCATSAFAQNYPTRPVRVIVPWPAGGSIGTTARIVTQRLSTLLHGSFVVDNRAGAAGTIGAELAAKSPADGHTLMVHSATHVANATTYKHLPYRTIEDFTPIAFLSAQPAVLVVHSSLSVKSTREFIALAKSRPAQINYASSGNGSSPHLAMGLFATTANISLTHVPFRGGPPAITSLLAGETQASIATLPNALPHVTAGRIRALGVTTAKRVASTPNIPTIAESGLPGYEMNPWISLFGPAGLKRELVAELNTTVNKILREPDIAKSMVNQGLEAWSGTPEQLAARMRADLDKFAKLIKAIGVTND